MSDGLHLPARDTWISAVRASVTHSFCYLCTYMKLEEFEIKGRRCVYRADEQPEVLLVEAIDARELEGLDAELSAIKDGCKQRFAYVALIVEDWNTELAPWTAAPSSPARTNRTIAAIAARRTFFMSSFPLDFPQWIVIDKPFGNSETYSPVSVATRLTLYACRLVTVPSVNVVSLENAPTDINL